MREKITKTSGSKMPAKLAKCAFELFADNGFAKVNLDQIAERAGVTKGSLYWHYKNKQALILAACEYYYAIWHVSANKSIKSADDPFDALRKLLVFSVNSCVIDQRNRLFTTGIFMLMQEDEDVKKSWSKFYDDVRNFYLEVVEQAQARGLLKEGDKTQSVNLMLEAIEGLKLRAGFEPHVSASKERKTIAEGLLRIFQG
ncbi:MAG: TetR/AcrR family transcriptional regulator [Kiritimatiellae bacterium]|nr:TetR/AcrR family transcriptional regulator [Kiritimatiellia bacterium]